MVYLDLVFALNFLVDFLLLIGTNSLTGFPHGVRRSAGAAAMAAMYGVWCIIPGFAFLGGHLWRLVALVLISLIAFGMNVSAFHRGVVFFLLSMALGGIAGAMGTSGFGKLAVCAFVLWLICRIGFPGGVGQREYVPVVLRHEGKSLSQIALLDTGNSLKDPVTGQPVLIAGCDAARELLNLSPEQLRHPIETMTAVNLSGLRLIPYNSVGQPAGLLLAYRFRDCKIGDRKTDQLVAFAPDRIGRTEMYQMLAGGAV